MTSALWPHLAATACQAAFALGCWLLLARLTTFSLSRAYLLAALVLSVTLPLPTAWAATTLLAPRPVAATALPATEAPGNLAQPHIGTITWQGNTVLTTAQLNEALGLKPGDAYSKEVLDSHLSYRPDNGAIGLRHMDQGYLFFQVAPVARRSPTALPIFFFASAKAHHFAWAPY